MADIVTEARQLLDAATPGPWYCFTDDSAGKDSLHLMSEYDDGSWVEGKQGPFPLDPFTYDPTPMERATAHFIAAAPRLVTELVAEVERLRQRNINNGTAFSDALARRDSRITGLIAERDAAVAEVERLREALDQRTDSEPERRKIEDGFGSVWLMCQHHDCDLQVVRPGKVQCSGYCDSDLGGDQ